MPGQPHELIGVESKTLGSTVEITVRGEIDIASIPRVAAPISNALKLRPDRLVIDLEAVEFLDSICVRLLAKTAGVGTATGVEVIVVPPAGFARRALDIVGLEFVMGRTDEPASDELDPIKRRSLQAAITERRKLLGNPALPRKPVSGTS